MIKKEVHPLAVKLTKEIGTLALKFVQTERAKRRMYAYTFCEELGIAHGIFTRITNEQKRAININTACRILDKIGYELKIVKKEEKS